MAITFEEFARRWAPCNSFKSPIGPWLQFRQDLREVIDEEVKKALADEDGRHSSEEIEDIVRSNFCSDCDLLNHLPNGVKALL